MSDEKKLKGIISSGNQKLNGVLTPKKSMEGKLSVPEARVGNYETLKNLPQINDNTVVGNKSFDDYGLSEITNIEIDNLFRKYLRW